MTNDSRDLWLPRYCPECKSPVKTVMMIVEPCGCFLAGEHLHPAVVVDPSPKIHILRGGRALCGLLNADWPSTHKWVSVEDRAEATCEGCRKAAAT